MEEVPILSCPLHPTKEKDEEGVARALTPTKTIPAVSTNPSQNSDGLVMPGELYNDNMWIDRPIFTYLSFSHSLPPLSLSLYPSIHPYLYSFLNDDRIISKVFTIEPDDNRIL